MLVVKRLIAISLFIIPVLMVIQFIFIGIPAFYRIFSTGVRISPAYKLGEVIGYISVESLFIGFGWICYRFGRKLWKSPIRSGIQDPEILDDILLEEKE